MSETRPRPPIGNSDFWSGIGCGVFVLCLALSFAVVRWSCAAYPTTTANQGIP